MNNQLCGKALHNTPTHLYSVEKAVMISIYITMAHFDLNFDINTITYYNTILRLFLLLYNLISYIITQFVIFDEFLFVDPLS